VTFVHSSHASDALKASVAQHMGHTVETARKQYNVAFRQEAWFGACGILQLNGPGDIIMLGVLDAEIC